MNQLNSRKCQLMYQQPGICRQLLIHTEFKLTLSTDYGQCMLFNLTDLHGYIQQNDQSVEINKKYCSISKRKNVKFYRRNSVSKTNGLSLATSAANRKIDACLILQDQPTIEITSYRDFVLISILHFSFLGMQIIMFLLTPFHQHNPTLHSFYLFQFYHNFSLMPHLLLSVSFSLLLTSMFRLSFQHSSA